MQDFGVEYSSFYQLKVQMQYTQHTRSHLSLVCALHAWISGCRASLVGLAHFHVLAIKGNFGGGSTG